MDLPLELKPGEKDIFDKFKEKVKDITKPEHDDFDLVKWLRVRSWDLDKAEKMFREDQKWRKEHDIDSLLTSYEPPEVLKKYYPGGIPGITKEGHPIWLSQLPLADARGFYNCLSIKDAARFQIYRREWLSKVVLPEVSKKLGKRITGVVFIVDLEGLGLSHLWKPAADAFGKLAAITEAHYPEFMHAAYVINAPSIFPLAFGLVKSFLSEETQAKTKVMGTNYKDDLLKDIDADQLPVHWGGTATDPDGDPYCRSKICMGGTIPEEYYRRNTLEENLDLSKFTSVTVQPGSTLQLDFPVKTKNSLLSWNFYTYDNDIGFGVYRQTSGDPDDLEAIVASERVNCHVIPESGSIQCETLGTYVILFDNKYSWINAKELYHFIEIVEPHTGK